jgi:formate-dependent nitrite reductase membrane component NrfD
MGAYVYARDNFRPLIRSGILISGPLVALGMPFLIYDLGAGKREPWRLFFLFFGNPSSIMTWGAWIISVFVLVALTLAFLEMDFRGPWPWLDRHQAHFPSLRRLMVGQMARLYRLQQPLMPLRRRLMVGGTLLALATSIYTGLLIGVLNSIPLWNTTILPVLFVASALSTGLAAAVVFAVLNPIEEERLLAHHFFHLNQIHSVMIVVEVVFIFSWLFLAANSSVAAAESVHLLMFGSLAPLFWGGLVFFGVLDPLLIYIYEVLLGKPLMAYGMLISDSSVLLGGFVLRYLTLAAGLPVVLF